VYDVEIDYDGHRGVAPSRNGLHFISTTQHPRCAEMRSAAPALLHGLLQNALRCSGALGAKLLSLANQLLTLL
jgi:hypothetical protein